jgi:uncharacterized protein involved in response to NO
MKHREAAITPHRGLTEAVRGLKDIPLLSYGFRPFFLAAGTWAAAAMLAWIGIISGQWSIAATYGAAAWHAHEFLFGYVGGVVTGFVLTTIPNWTGRLPVRGFQLLALLLLWLAGRAALFAVDTIGALTAAAIDSMFLVMLECTMLREIVAGRNWRNLKVAALILVFALANIGFHAEVIVQGTPFYSLRAAVATAIILIMLVGGRIVPSFTRNWLVRQGAVRLPSPFGRFDVLAIATAIAGLTSWIAAPTGQATALLGLAAGVMQLARLVRWCGISTWREPLLLVLHAGYLFIPVGLLLIGLAAMRSDLVPPTSVMHALTAGAMGLMTLAVMTRATLGHTGRALTADAATKVIYAAVLLAAIARMIAPVTTPSLLYGAAIAWIAGFAGFAVRYGPYLAGAPKR